MIEVAIIVSMIVGTVFGLFVGFKRGLFMGIAAGTQVTVDQLIKEKYLKTRTENGQIIVVRYDEETA